MLCVKGKGPRAHDNKAPGTNKTMRQTYDMTAYKASCKEQLEACKAEYQETENTIRELYKAGKQEEAWGLFDTERELKRRIEYLTTESIEKKYATECLYSDAHAYEVLQEINPNKYLVRQMKATMTEESMKATADSFIPCGFLGRRDNELQRWTFESNPEGHTCYITRRKDGRWYQQGTHSCHFIILDHPYEHYDFNF